MAARTLLPLLARSGYSAVEELLPPLARGLKKAAQQVRAGDVALRDGRPWRVARFSREHGQARASGSVVLDFKDLGSQARSSVRFRPEEVVELVELTKRGMQVLYMEGDVVHLMDPESYEQHQVEAAVFGDDPASRRWLAAPDLVVDCQLLEGRVVAGSLPFKVRVRVVEAKPAVKREDGTSNRHVVVEGGAQVLAPAHISAGDVILVRTQDCSYLSKDGS